MPTALVTGAAGFIGSHLVEELLARGYRVRGLDNLQIGSRENLEAVLSVEQFSFIEGDIRDQETVQTAMADVDVVFHLAAETSVPASFKRPRAVSAVNCTGTAIVLETAVEGGVKSVLLASSAAVYGSDAPVPVSESAPTRPESPYAASKRYGEQLGEHLGDERGLDVVALRFFNVYGPRQDPTGDYAAVIPKFISLMTDGTRPTIFGDGEQTRDFVYVEDVVRGCVDAVESTATGVYNIGSGDRVSINELVTALNEVINTELTPVYDDPRPGDIKHSGADITKAQNVFRYKPSIDLHEGLAITLHDCSN